MKKQPLITALRQLSATAGMKDTKTIKEVIRAIQNGHRVHLGMYPLSDGTYKIINFINFQENE